MRRITTRVTRRVTISSLLVSLHAYREVNRNTLADTPSGYIMDPANHPRHMVEYTKPSPYTERLLEAMQKEKELLEQEALDFSGYCPPAVRNAKVTVLRATSTEAELEAAVRLLEEELERIAGLVGSEVERELSDQAVLLLKWQQRQRRLQDRDSAFRQTMSTAVATSTSDCVIQKGKGYEVELQEDGTERITRKKKKGIEEAAEEGEENEFLWRSVESEVLPPEVLKRETVTVTEMDVLHVRYLLGIALRRVGRFAEAVDHHYRILSQDVANVDAMESLLEVFLGCDQWEDLKALLDWLEVEYARAVEEGRVTPPPPPKELTRKEEEEEGKETSSSAEKSSKETKETFLSPLHMCLSLLADMIVEAAAKECQSKGEGSTSKFFIDALAPIVGAIGPVYTGLLLQALFKTLESQLFVAYCDGDVISPTQRQATFALTIAFYKALLARQLYELVPDPLKFEYYTLTKLNFALRQSGKIDESIRIAHRLLKLYRRHSSLYQYRMRQRELTLLEWDLRRQQVPEEEKEAQLAAKQREVASLPPLPAGLLDGEDADYREVYFGYVNDVAGRSTKEGRKVCLECMEEFPTAATPWRIMALLLHAEDPKKNLKDAVLAARQAVELDPMDLTSVVVLANLYKADNRLSLHHLMMDRYRLLCYMAEHNASPDDLRSVNREILDMEKQVVEDLCKEDDDLAKHELMMAQSLHYIVPMNQEERVFGSPPIKVPAMEPEAQNETVRDMDTTGRPVAPQHVK